MEAIMASIESTAAVLSIPPSSSEAPTKTVKQKAYVDNPLTPSKSTPHKGS
jgi:hypothetical protein